jgi:O-antigen biosynthesis protein
MFQPVKVVDVELTAGVRGVEDLEGYAAVMALIRVHGAPIGQVSVPVEGGRCSADALRREIAHVSRDASPSRTSRPPGSSEVTVAVCTRNRTASLADCLRSLTRLRDPRIDLLVVDNAPDSDATERLVRSYPGIRYVLEPRPGLNWARNRAIAEARGTILAYTDDDVMVDAGWVDAVAGVFAEHAEVQAVTGLVVPQELETEAQALFESRAGFGRGFERRWYRRDAPPFGPDFHVPAWRFGTGANMAFRTRLFETIGGFDPALDVGTVTGGGGDLEMFFRVLEEGHTLVYEPAAIVRHRHRRDYGALKAQLKDYGIGRSAFLVRCAAAYPRRRRAIIRYWLRSTRGRVLRLLQSCVAGHAVTRQLTLADVAGTFLGLVRYRRARRIATEIERAFGPIDLHATRGRTPMLEPLARR